MVHLLYAVTAFVCALVVLILPARTRGSLSRNNPLDKAFFWLVEWIAIFCIADGAWGLLASDLLRNDTLLFVGSSVFHLFTAFTPLVWLHFVISYLGNVRFKRLYYAVSIILFVAQAVLLVINFKTRSLFHIDADGLYCSGDMRELLFYAQYAIYVTTALVALFRIAGNDRSKSSHRAVLAFVAAPLVFGLFQQLYPDAPAYSIGYMLGCCIIYSFVVTELLEARVSENLQMTSANNAKTAFLNSMSHDIRTPLNAITGFNNMALTELGRDDYKVKDCLEKIGRSTDTLLTIINDILEISRIESGKITLSEDKGNVKYSFVNIQAMMEEIADKAGISLEFTYGNIDDLYVICDIPHCVRVFTNLISNAIKYTNRGGNVWVHCEQTGRRDGYGIYTYTFKDNGIGMTEEFQKQLFQPFTRENNATVNNIQGTGLGLALCKNLVDVMGGTINCQSRLNEGTTFTVTLPFKIQEGQEYEVPECEKSTADLDRILRNKHILLVEDNDLNREIAASILTQMGAQVTEANDGSEAVSLMRTPEADAFDLILMDIQMPILDGYEATRQIRAMGTKASRIPIVAMTANAYEEDRKEAFAAGMNGHIAKPVDLAVLTATLKKFLM